MVYRSHILLTKFTFCSSLIITVKLSISTAYLIFSVKKLSFFLIHLSLISFVGMPPHPNISEFETVWARGKSSSLKSMTLLSALFRNQNEV